MIVRRTYRTGNRLQLYYLISEVLTPLNLTLRPLFSLVLLVVASASVVAQTKSSVATPPPTSDDKIGTMHFQANVGSFKLIDGKGHAEVSFTGTILVSKYKGKPIVVTGNVRQEYKDKDREIWFGTGKFIVDGQWHGIQWFGKDMVGVWTGAGLIRIAGEFDKNLDTGTYWYGDSTEKKPWYANGTMTVENPEKHFGATGTPKKIEKPGKGG